MTQSVLFTEDAYGRFRVSDPPTSQGAAVIAIGNAATNRHAALVALGDVFPYGFTDFELAEVTRVQQTSIGKRRGELRDAGLVEAVHDEDGKRVTRPSPSGTPAQVWRITAAGRCYLEEHQT